MAYSFFTESEFNIYVDASRISGERGSQHCSLAEYLHFPEATAANLGTSVVPTATALPVSKAPWRLPGGSLEAAWRYRPTHPASKSIALYSCGRLVFLPQPPPLYSAAHTHVPFCHCTSYYRLNTIPSEFIC